MVDVVDGPAVAEAAQRGPVAVYVVQVREEAGEDEQGGQVFAWRDFARIGVPRRTKRRTVVERALAEAPGLRPTSAADEPLLIRVLSPEDARPFSVSTIRRDPELRIEGA